MNLFLISVLARDQASTLNIYSHVIPAMQEDEAALIAVLAFAET